MVGKRTGRFALWATTLINRLGSLIAQKKLSENDVQVVVFEDSVDNSKNVTQCLAVTFNEDGELLNWPYGFFLPNKS